eukprot:363852-Chlamydomonas_euryale.AAC.8
MHHAAAGREPAGAAGRQSQPRTAGRGWLRPPEFDWRAIRTASSRTAADIALGLSAGPPTVAAGLPTFAAGL